MINIFYKTNGKIICEKKISFLEEISLSNILWVDLVSASCEDKAIIEQHFCVRLQSRQEAEEIESSSRFFETEDRIIANSNFLILNKDSYHDEPVSFIIKDNILISYRNAELKSFNDTFRKLELNLKQLSNGYQIFLAILEIRIDLDADLLESLAKDIAELAKEVTLIKDLDEELILEITKYQEMTMMLRENIIDKQRVVSAVLKSDLFPKDNTEKLRIMIKDIGSLLDHTNFSFERLEYLQDTFLGLVNIEQNKIIKIFTVVTVIFMPPTLIASMYGMNFRFMPELEWEYGYLIAIMLMIFSSVGTLLFFIRKRWL
ncbi:MAG: magnesium and cobalt transport protein CorA [Bacteroidetes bacterium GWA2_30_7]|nr:MAG: magnesium and cobalt transport protein CorA [Bacteroidetes bacterium GWA2_30_7]